MIVITDIEQLCSVQIWNTLMCVQLQVCSIIEKRLWIYLQQNNS